MKKLTLIGIGIVLLSLLLIYSSSLQFGNSLGNSTQQSALLTPHNTLTIPFQIVNTTILGTFYYANSSNVSYYMMGSSAFQSLSAYLNSSSLVNKSSMYEGNGLYELIYANSSGTFPDQAPYLLRPPDYYYNGTAILSPGTYYNLFQNNGNSTIIVYYSIVQKLQLSVNNTIISSALYGLFSAFLFLIGIAVIGYSVMFNKDDASKAAVEAGVGDKSIDALYAKYDAKKPGRRHAKKHRSKARKRKKQK